MSVPDIHAKSAQQALRDIHYSNDLRESPLLDLALVDAWLHHEGVVDTRENRAWGLTLVLHDVIRQELFLLRSMPAEVLVSRDPRAQEQELRADLASNSPGRALANTPRAWYGLLHSHYVLAQGRPLVQMADDLTIHYQTLRRRMQRGYATLAKRVAELEHEARADLDQGQISLSPADRIQAVEPLTHSDASGARQSAGYESPADRDASGIREKTPGPFDRSAATPVEQSSPVDGPIELTRSCIEKALRSDGGRLRVAAADLAALGDAPVHELRQYHLSRIAEWSLPRHRLDQRFVPMTLLVEAPEGGHQKRSLKPNEDEIPPGLHQMMMQSGDRSFVLLGPPGSGKSTLLRRVQLERSVDAIRDSSSEQGLSFIVPLSQYRPAADGQLLDPRAFLMRRWASIYPHLPALSDFMDGGGGLTLLLDGLNEMPHADAAAYRKMVMRWREFAESFTAHAGNRILFSCRSLDYSAPLSSPSHKVSRIQVEALNDAQIQGFLRAYAPEHAARIWNQIEADSLSDLYRLPYSLRLLVDLASEDHELPRGRAGLFTRIIRHTMRREIERGNPQLDPGVLLSERDYRRLLSGKAWRSDHALPERGILFDSLTKLAFEMQRGDPQLKDGSKSIVGKASIAGQVRIDYDEALDILGDAGEDILATGASLGLLDDDPANDMVFFYHQLVQEYFAARHLLMKFDPDLVAQPFKRLDLDPDDETILEGLGLGEALPEPPSTGWEETVLMAAEMHPEPSDFVEELRKANMSLAGRCLSLPALQDRCDEALRVSLARDLAQRAGDQDVDLRHRMTAGLVAGELGDPRLRLHEGDFGPYLLPTWVPVGSGPQLSCSSSIVSNAEWLAFMNSGAYQQKRWWSGEGYAWLQNSAGTGTTQKNLPGKDQITQDPALIERWLSSGELDENMAKVWRRRLAKARSEARDEDRDEDHGPESISNLSSQNAELGSSKSDQSPGAIDRPRFWDNDHFNSPAQAVIGISHFEAQAYCAWISSQSGLKVRLPSLPEWRRIASGPDTWPFPWGPASRRRACNSIENRLRRPSPAGIFPASDTPQGIHDLLGNVSEWTSTPADPNANRAPNAEVSLNGRAGLYHESPSGSMHYLAVGGAWNELAANLTTLSQQAYSPSYRNIMLGLRLVYERTAKLEDREI